MKSYVATLLCVLSTSAALAADLKAPATLPKQPASFEVPVTTLAKLDVMVKSYQKDQLLIGDCHLAHAGYIASPENKNRLGFKFKIQAPGAAGESGKTLAVDVLPQSFSQSITQSDSGLRTVTLGYLQKQTAPAISPQVLNEFHLQYDNAMQIHSLDAIQARYSKDGKLVSSQKIKCGQALSDEAADPLSK